MSERLPPLTTSGTDSGTPRFPGPLSFKDDDDHRKLFRGREEEKYELFHLVAAEPIVLLFGRSGLGKSSLINAGLLEPLRRDGYFPMVVRVTGGGTPLDSVFAGVEIAVNDQETTSAIGIEHEPHPKDWDRSSLSHLFSSIQLWKADELQLPVLIIDQFEELFTRYEDADARRLFIDQLANLVRGVCPKNISEESGPEAQIRAPTVKVILSFREDFYANIQELRDRIPAVYKAPFRLGPLTRKKAQQAIEGPSEVEGDQFQSNSFTWDEQALDQTLDFLSEQRRGEGKTIIGDEIEPFQLQLICSHIEKIVLDLQINHITSTELGGEDSLSTILSNFYEDSLDRICEAFSKQPDLRTKLELLCEDGLMTPRGRRLLREESTIEHDDGIDKSVLGKMVDERLVRTEPRIGDKYYELTHDTLIDPIQQSRNARLQKREQAERRRKAWRRGRFIGVCALIGLWVLSLVGEELYQRYGDTDPDRGGLAMDGKDGNPVGALGEKFSTPVYLDQGWNAADSLWFYNTTQGSALMPYDLFLVLEEARSEELLRSDENMDAFRYLVQKPTSFNPDGLPVGFVKDTYSGSKWWYDVFKEDRDYVGFTCAACHTGQINYTKPGNDVTTAVRIDGGAAMADMVGFLKALEAALYAVTVPGEKQSRFVQAVIDLGNEYSDEQHVIDDTKKWYGVIRAYNVINESSATDEYGKTVKVDYGHARLDAFGRIYNRVLQYVISVQQAKTLMAAARYNGRPILTGEEMVGLFEGVADDVILTDDVFVQILQRVGALGLTDPQLLALRKQIFNEANAPVSYPYLWDIVQSTNVLWTGRGKSSGAGPIKRNVGKLIGTFSVLDWEATEAVWYRAMSWRLRSWLSSFATGQTRKKKHLTFDSSIDFAMLEQLQRKLTSLESPMWPRVSDQGEEAFNSQFGEAWVIDMDKAQRGRRLFERYCISCHEGVVRDDPDRILVTQFTDIDDVLTDPLRAINSVAYVGASGIFENNSLSIDGPELLIRQEAPVLQLLDAAVDGILTTPDSDKSVVRRWYEWPRNWLASLASPDYKSLEVPDGIYYKARPLNGIWATAPYLHNGSVPTLYDLLLPADCSTATDGKCRPAEFLVGAREFDPYRVGIVYEGLDESLNFSTFDTTLPGNSNAGHEYAAGKTPVTLGQAPLRQMTESERWDLIEYLKTL